MKLYFSGNLMRYGGRNVMLRLPALVVKQFIPGSCEPGARYLWTAKVELNADHNLVITTIIERRKDEKEHDSTSGTGGDSEKPNEVGS